MNLSRIALSCRSAPVLEELETEDEPRGKQLPAEIPAHGREEMKQPMPNELTTLHLVPETIEHLRRAFDAHNLSQSGLQQALGPDASERLARADLPLYERRLAARSPLNTLLKLFVLRVWVDKPDVRAALFPLPLEEVVALGLVEADSRGVRARVGLSFCEGLWLFHDPMVEDMEHLAPAHVLGTNPAAFTLANLTVRSQVRTALDVGTGCGVQALLTARHAQQVIATDTNPRALNFTSFNARLNRLENVECRLGSFFEPVRGERFDLIVCNPPFVVSPASQYLFRDSGRPADTLSQEVVTTAPQHLNSGGVASILCSWIQRKDTEWSARPREWVSQSGCDACLFRGGTHDPLSYAASWNRGHDALTFGQQLDEWQEYYQKLEIHALSVGAIVLRRREGVANWIRTDDLPKTFVGSCSEHLQRIIQAQDFLAGLSDDGALFEHAYELPPDHLLRQTLHRQEQGFAIRSMELQLKGGLQFSGNIDAATFELLRRCDGRRPLKAIISELAAIGKTTFPAIQPQASQVARELIRCGLLVPNPGPRALGVPPSSSGDDLGANSSSAPSA